MRLGIDFGTTRIVCAAVDRGNYPVVTFEAADGGSCDWFPSLVAVRGEQRLYGWDAWLTQEEPGWTVVRSMKRFLEDAGPETRVEIGGQILPMRQWLRELMGTLQKFLMERSSQRPRPGEVFEIMLGVPANANSNQRFLTVQAFREAGFQVLGLLNEPSAASIEFGHRERGAGDSESILLVYDWGGGTFDASLVRVDQRTHSVIATEGISTLGGDDFDHILAELALDAAGISHQDREGLSQAEWFHLQEECRDRKEALHPSTRKIVVDLEAVRAGWQPVTIPVAEFYDRCQPLIRETVSAVEDLLASQAGELSALYMTGGGSELPIVARVLRESFGRRVRRSAHTRSATAIGLAIQADEQAGYVLRERFTRHFGVWREGEGGRTIVFDPLFEKGTPLPAPNEPTLVNQRRYHPVHNVGHFRYLECSHRAPDGQPRGDITIWDEIFFPFDPGIRDERNLADTKITHSEEARSQQIEERYSCDAGGTVRVEIRNRSSDYERSYTLGRWSMKETAIRPGPKRKREPKA